MTTASRNGSAPTLGPRRTCLVGAGNVSRIHVEALREVPDAKLWAICDANIERARALAAEAGVERIFGSVDEVVAAGDCDAAHVLVPPRAHGAVADQLVEGRIGVLLEKPMGSSSAECRQLLRDASAQRVPIGVNHNATFFPAHAKLRERVLSGRHGPLQHLTVLVNFPRNGVGHGDHWMLQAPENVVFESGVHPLSQIHDLAGPLISAETTVSGRRRLPSGAYFFDTWQVSMVCERATAQLFLSYGGGYDTWLEIALCEDGALSAEMESSRITATGRTRWGPYLDLPARGASIARQELVQSLTNFVRESVAAIRPFPRRDPYFASMRDSIAAFHASSTGSGNGEAGSEVVAMCEKVAEAIVERGQVRQAVARTCRIARPDAVVLGGTGFIGRALVEQMLSRGMSVRVLSRAPNDEQSKRGVEVMSGDVADPDALKRAITGARWLVHLAHGGQFQRDALESTMFQPARRIVELCASAGVERLIYAGTIASLYLGSPEATIRGTTPLDPMVEQRGPYEWGKARSEMILLERARERSLPLCIMRPGIVLGAGGTPFHTGFGTWRGKVHCVGWNLGTNPLPLVLVSDVAAAIMLALDKPASVGRTYNLVGDVRLSARRCVAELKQALGRPLVFHARLPSQHLALALSKWSLKAATGRRSRPPSYRGIKSLGCVSQFDCDDVKQELGWQPVQDASEFIERALHIHARSRGADR